MKLSEQWLREWVNPKISSEELAARLTMAGLEVDGLTPVAGNFHSIIVAQVTQTCKHPQADKLTLCVVDAGKENLKIVCGAANVRAGLKVALAQIGAVLPSGMKIKETKLRGELSQGMLCSAAELGLAESSEGILEFPENAPVGTDLREYLHLNDNIIEVDLTPNRADCFSVLGIAREVAADSRMKTPHYTPATLSPAHDDAIPVTIEAEKACSSYQCRVIRGIHPEAKSPIWLIERLRRSGLRSIHPIVDITNYVMMECGQPLHAFDADALEGSLHVRYAKKNETLVLLDGQEKILDSNVLLIADEVRALAMAGIMGGADSAVQESSVNIVLESAWFHPKAIAGVARAYGLCTDSSQRFERGVDPTLQTKAIERATALILEICGGKTGPVSGKTLLHHSQSKTKIDFNPAKVEKLTGVLLTEDDMRQILEALGMQIESKSAVWSVSIPSWRFDLESDVDLIEEIIRIHGYDKIAGSPMHAKVRSGKFDNHESVTQTLTKFFTARGYHETISYSFVDPALQNAVYPNQKALNLLNPISSELSQMRMGLWPGLLASLIYNVHRQHRSLKLFETGVRFFSNDTSVHEEAVFSGLLTGEYAPYSWCEIERVYDFYDVKGDIKAALNLLGIEQLKFETADHPALHPGQSAQITHNGLVLGFLGVLHPALIEELELPDEVMLFELSLATLPVCVTKKYRTISKFPLIRRDLSLLMKDSINAEDIEACVRTVIDSSLLKSFNVFDVYHGDNLPDGYKSMAITLEMQNSQRTLVDDEINNKISAILQLLDERLSIKLRE